MFKESFFGKLIVISLFLVSCSDDDAVYKIGDKFTTVQSKIHFVDTITVSASTVLLDSFPTSGYNKIFVGYNMDEQLGNSYAESYVEFTHKGSLPELDSTVTFDSIVLYLRQSGAYSGDTNIIKTIAIHRVLEEITPRELNNTLNNSDNFLTSAEPYAELSFEQWPRSLEENFCRLPDSLGLNWFQMIVDKDSIIVSDDNFKEYFQGLAIKPITKDISWSATFYGVDELADNKIVDELQIRLYFRRKNEMENEFFAFVPSEKSKIFTHYKIDHTGSILDGIENTTQILSGNTNNLMFVQAGGRVGFRIDVPLINNLNELHPNMSIMSARLIIKPSKGTYEKASKLPTLHAYWIDSNNEITELLTDVTGQFAITSELNADDFYDENTYYSFNVLNYILYKMDRAIYSNESLFFSLSAQDNATTFNRVVLEDQSFSKSLELQLYYVVY